MKLAWLSYASGHAGIWHDTLKAVAGRQLSITPVDELYDSVQSDELYAYKEWAAVAIEPGTCLWYLG